MAFKFQPLDIPEVIRIDPDVYEDSRGRFLEIYKASAFRQAGLSGTFIQDNISHSIQGVLRGLHYQSPPHAQAKLIMVLSGEIFDVAVDIRRGSPTYRRWVHATLSAANRRMLYIPEGFAHGFCAVSDQASVLYKTTAEYSPAHDRGILWNDPALGIKWPVTSPIVSAKDAQLPRFQDAEPSFVYNP